MTNILITGGAGYIGSHIAEQLINNKEKVIIIDKNPHHEGKSLACRQRGAAERAQRDRTAFYIQYLQLGSHVE